MHKTGVDARERCAFGVLRGGLHHLPHAGVAYEGVDAQDQQRGHAHDQQALLGDGDVAPVKCGVCVRGVEVFGVGAEDRLGAVRQQQSQAQTAEQNCELMLFLQRRKKEMVGQQPQASHQQCGRNSAGM